MNRKVILLVALAFNSTSYTLRYEYITEQLGINYNPTENIDLDNMEALERIIVPLSNLYKLGLSEDQIVGLIKSWREEGETFPDDRRDPYAVSNDLIVYAEQKGYSFTKTPLMLADYEPVNIGFELKYNDLGHPIGVKPRVYQESETYSSDAKAKDLLLIEATTTKNPDIKTIKTIKKLIQWGANINEQDPQGFSPLINAALNGNLEVVNSLLEAGADTYLQNYIGNTALTMAALEGHEKIVRRLINEDADTNHKSNSGNTPLIFAALKGHLGVVNALIEYGVPLNVVDSQGNTALILAAYKGFPDIVKALIEAGASLNIENDSKTTALGAAQLANNEEIVQILNAAGAKQPRSRVRRVVYRGI